jgi:hypothetical protein
MNAKGRLAICQKGRLGIVNKVKYSKLKVPTYVGIGFFDFKPWQSKKPVFICKEDLSKLANLGKLVESIEKDER